MKGLEICTLVVSIFSLYQSQAMVILKGGQVGEKYLGLDAQLSHSAVNVGGEREETRGGKNKPQQLNPPE